MKAPFVAVRESPYGRKRRFVAVQHNARNGGRSRRSVDAVCTGRTRPGSDIEVCLCEDDLTTSLQIASLFKSAIERNTTPS
jgi:hypothetical protein